MLRAILMGYCLFVSYCCTWIPWQVTCGSGPRKAQYITYSWVWSAPKYCIFGGTVGPQIAVITLRIISATTISAAIFIVADWYSSRERRVQG
jgi:hypothetical protein